MGQETGAQKWAGILYNYSYNVGLGSFAGPGHWNDPDFLLAGDSGLTTAEMQAQMSLWSEMAAPLNSSTDLTKLSPEALAVLGNTRIIAVDQDPLGVQGHIIQSGADYDVLTKPLANGDVSVVLFNKAATAQTIVTTATRAGLAQESGYRLTNLVTGAVSTTTGTIGASVQPHGTAMFRVHPGADHAAPSALVPYMSATMSAQGLPTSVRVAVGNYGLRAVRDGRVSLSVPAGWKATPASEQLATIPTGGGSAQATFAVTPPALSPGNNTYPIVAAVTAGHGRQAETVTGYLTAASDIPYPTLSAAFDNVGITDSTTLAKGDFDGSGNSYSASALAAAGAKPGASITHDGVTFTWPGAAAGTPDNVAAAGQAIALSGTGEIAFLGSNTGAQRETLTVHYTDGSTSTAEIGFPSWCASCTDVNEYGAQPVITTDLRNGPSGHENQGLNYDVYYNTLPTDQGKAIASVTLPDDAGLHVFAMAVKKLVAPPFTGNVYASDAQWVSATNGWGPVERDHSNGENAWGDGNAITMNGIVYAKGLGTAPFTGTPGVVTYDLAGKCTSFTAIIGDDDEELNTGESTGFAVVGDGKTLFNSKVFTSGSTAQPITVDVSGVQQLQLQTNDGGNGNGNDHGDWADAMFHCNG